MQDLRAHLKASLHGRILWLGVGNPDYVHDQAGILLAQYLRQYGLHNVAIAGPHPERAITSTSLPHYDHVVFLDAVELNAVPGSVVFLASHEIITRFPQISTQKISLGLLAQWVESQNHARAWLLGIQPPTLSSFEFRVSSDDFSPIPSHSKFETRHSKLPRSVLLLGNLLVTCFATNPSSIFHLPSSSPIPDLLSPT